MRVKTEEGNAIELNDYPLSEIRFRPRGQAPKGKEKGRDKEEPLDPELKNLED